MSTGRSSALRFIARALTIFVVATALWVGLLEPPYDRVVARAGVRLAQAVERTPRVAGVRFEGPYAVVTRTPAAELGEQRLELRTHHDNVPLLAALMLAGEASLGARLLRFAAAGGILACAHVAHFLLAIHWEYAVHNVGTYHVDDVAIVTQPFWQRLRNRAELRKTLVNAAYLLQAHMGRLVLPVLLWMLLARGYGPVGSSRNSS